MAKQVHELLLAAGCTLGAGVRGVKVKPLAALSLALVGLRPAPGDPELRARGQI
jgi:hypothetical protein